MDEELNIKSVRSLLKKGQYFIETIISGYNVSFGEKEVDNVTDEMIEFAIDLVKSYIEEPKKYYDVVIDKIMNYLDDKANLKQVLQELGKPDISIDTENSASLWYSSIKEIGEHLPEVRVDRNLLVYDVSLNG